MATSLALSLAVEQGREALPTNVAAFSSHSSPAVKLSASADHDAVCPSCAGRLDDDDGTSGVFATGRPAYLSRCAFCGVLFESEEDGS